MPQITMKESAGYALHDEGEFYDGTIIDIEDTHGEFGPGLKWIINLDGDTYDDGTPRDTWAFSSQNLSTRSKLYKWAAGIIGKEQMPASDEVFDTVTLVGRRVKVQFEHYPGVDRDGKPTTKEKVVAIRASQTEAPDTETPFSEIEPASTPVPPADDPDLF